MSQRKEIDERYLVDLENVLKPLNSADDLIAVGLFKNKKTLHNMRSAGTGPTAIKIPGAGGLIYPKTPLIDWLKKKAKVRQEPC